MARVICIDFDDTLVLDNTMAQIMQRFAGAAWGDVAERYRRGEISVEQQNAEGLDLVEAEPDEIRQFVREVARPRPGILELNDWAQWNGWLVTIVSNGFAESTGSCSNTSSAAPAIFFDCNASISAGSSTTGPRDTLMK